MIVNENAYRSKYTPWGVAVKKALLDRGMEQDELVRRLIGMGYEISKGNLSALLKGIGFSKRKSEVEAINEILGISL